MKELSRNDFRSDLNGVFSFRPFATGCCCGTCPFSTNKTALQGTKCLIFNFMPLRPFQSKCNISGSNYDGAMALSSDNFELGA